MTRARRRLIIGIISLALAALLAYLLRGPLGMALLPRLAQHRMAADLATQLPDGLHVGLCGSGSPFPDEERAGPCTASSTAITLARKF